MPSISIRISLFLALLPLLGLLIGCESSLVEPGRGIPSQQPLVPAPATMPPQPPDNASNPNSLPHVPLSQLLPAQPVNANAVYHQVRAGETLSAIAARHQLTADQLRRANGLDAQATLQPGQLIYIPGAR